MNSVPFLWNCSGNLIDLSGNNTHVHVHGEKLGLFVIIIDLRGYFNTCDIDCREVDCISIKVAVYV